MKTRILSLFVIALLGVSEIAFAQKTINKSFSGVKRIRLTTGSGDCEIKKATGTSVELVVEYTYDDRDWAARIEQTGDRLVLGEDHKANSISGRVSWKLSVPDGIKIDLTTGSGNIIVSDLNINLDLKTGSGDLEFSNLRGELDANTGSGNVELAGFNGQIKINTGSGDMRIENSDGEANLNCGSGDIKLVNGKGIFAVNTGSGDVTADKVTINGKSRFNTGSGRARITLAATPKFDLSVNSGSGNSEVGFNGNEIAGIITMKASKRNGTISAPFEFDKTEEVQNGGSDVTIVKTATRGSSTAKIQISTGSGSAVLMK